MSKYCSVVAGSSWTRLLRVCVCQGEASSSLRRRRAAQGAFYTESPSSNNINLSLHFSCRSSSKLLALSSSFVYCSFVPDVLQPCC
eukprot:1928480-Pleurochrysis_carterae.AAC.1